MKKICKFFVWLTFKIQLKIIFLIKKPFIVLVVWWWEKAFIRQKLVNLLKNRWIDVKIKYRPYTTWFWVALNALDLPSAWSNKLGWVWVWFLSWLKFLKHIFSYNKFVVLEWWIDEIWEAKKFVSLLNPHMIIFSSINQEYKDDLERVNIILWEYKYLVSYLNKKAAGLEKLNEEGDLDKVVDFIVKKEKYAGVINKKYEILSDLWNNLIRKIYLKE